jgi:hypothetical protein
MTRDYDLANPPSADEWLALDESERIRLVEAAHQRTRSPVGQNPNAHATIHVMVENQLAEGKPAPTAAYQRFIAAGVDRHTTIHALSSVVTRHMLTMLETQTPVDEATAARDFDALDPAAFKRKR